MYLFPFERVMYKPMPSWAKVEATQFEYDTNKYSDILICNSSCDRRLRPLSCRIFPLTPYIRDGKLKIILDPRAKAICPLAVLNMEDLDYKFVNRVELVFKMLIKNKLIYSFIQELSCMFDETYEKYKS